MPNTSPICADLLLVFARGSGQNKDGELTTQPLNEDFAEYERESYSFFNWHKSHLDVEYPNVTYKAVSVHDFPGKYDPVGYKAVSVGFPMNGDTTINAEASWFPGDYRDSVNHGVAETVGYLRDQIASCPDQSIIIGGYSQGAQVVGDSLFQLTPAEQRKILGVGLFGDPKYVASSNNPLNPFDKPVSYPWRRGDATNKDSGMLDPRIPYVPAELQKRTASYCMKIDIVCSGWSAVRADSRQAHGSYAAEPMRNVVGELMQWAAPQLAAAERARGGLGGDGPAAPTAAQLAKSRDIMFLLNDDSSDTVLQTFRYNLDPVLWPITEQYTGTQYGVKGYGEGEQSGQSLPRVNNIQALLPLTGYDPAKPMTTVSNIARSINSRYAFGQTQMGGGDYADPHGLAIEKSVFSGGWRAEAEKHLVLFTDRPVKQNYSYNICNASVRSWLQIPNTNGYEACYTNFGHDVWPKVQHPEVCETVHMAITQDQCTNPLKDPGYTQFNTRHVNDGIMAAQSQNIAVSVVVPYKITDPHNQFGVEKMINELTYLAQSTGGKFIYYDQRTKYDQVMLNDTLRQIFGHTPKALTLAYKEALDGQKNFKKGNLVAPVGPPVVLDVSGSNTQYNSYSWDFDDDGIWDQTTDGPVTETIFVAPRGGFVRVLGANTDGQSAETRVAVVATQPSGSTQAPDQPVAPEVTGSTNADGSIILEWQTEQPGDIIFIDPASSLPAATSQLSNQTLTFTPESAYTQLYAYVVNEGVVSEQVVVQIVPYVSPTPDPDDVEAPPEEPVVLAELDPTLCYKLQTCSSSSSPPSEFVQTEQTQAPRAQSNVVQTTTSQPIVTQAEQPQVAAATNTRQLEARHNLVSAVTTSSKGAGKTNANIWLLYVLAVTLITVLLIARKILKLKS